MEPIAEAVITIAVALILAVLSYYLDLLTKYGAVTSVITGAIVGIFGSLSWFIVLILFTVAGFAATRIGFFRKKAQGLQEGVRGERTHMNVLGVGIAPCVFAMIHFVLPDEYSLLTCIGFIASISVAAADTIASEIGVKDKNVILCTTFKRVPPGTDGGISVFGTLAALAGAAFASVLGWVVIYHDVDILVLIPIAAGMVGCFMDSIFGATIESSGKISKYTNNASTGIIGALFAMLIAYPLLF